MDDSADMVKVAHRLMQFYQNESCGKCTPCREGTRWMVQVLSRIEAGGGTFDDLQVIKEVCKSMADQFILSISCWSGSTRCECHKEFRGEFEAYIQKNPNAQEHPKMKVSLSLSICSICKDSK